MKKQVFGRKLSRGLKSRRALFRALIRALVNYGSIKTTKAKAKAVQADIDKIVGLAKEGGVSAKRHVYAMLGNDRETTETIFSKIVPALNKQSGFTRIINLERRKGDYAEIVRLEWTEKVQIKEKVQDKKTTKPGKAEGKNAKPSLKSRAAKILKSDKSK